MKYSIVIATYNHCDDLLKKCVEAIIAYSTLEDIELVIIANGCYDETKEYLLYLESYFKRTKIGGFQQVFFTEALGRWLENVAKPVNQRNSTSETFRYS